MINWQLIFDLLRGNESKTYSLFDYFDEKMLKKMRGNICVVTLYSLINTGGNFYYDEASTKKSVYGY